MTTQIILEGDIARTVEIRELSVAPLSAVLPHLERMAPTVLPILPKGTVAATFDPDSKAGTLLVERPPRRVEVTIYGDGDDEDEYDDAEETYRLSLPFQYWLFAYEVRPDDTRTPFALGETKYLWAKEPVTSPDSLLTNGLLANIGEDGYICWGSTWTNESSLVGNINERVNSFYTTVFNGDLGHRKPRAYGRYQEWHDDSARNPLCWQEWAEWDDEYARFPVSRILNFGGYSRRAIDPADSQTIDVSRPSIWSPQPALFTQARIQEHLATLTPRQRAMTRRALAAIESQA